MLIVSSISNLHQSKQYNKFHLSNAFKHNHIYIKISTVFIGSAGYGS